jgi:hypothetical protein
MKKIVSELLVSPEKFAAPVWYCRQPDRYLKPVGLAKSGYKSRSRLFSFWSAKSLIYKYSKITKLQGTFFTHQK